MAPARGAAFASSVRMVYRVHYYAAYFGAMTQPPATARLSEGYVAMLDVSYLADCGVAFDVDSANFA
jgi:hypothetical protein